MLLVNLAAVRRKKDKKITEEEGKTDEQTTRIEAGASGADKYQENDQPCSQRRVKKAASRPP